MSVHLISRDDFKIRVKEYIYIDSPTTCVNKYWSTHYLDLTGDEKSC